MKTILKTIVMTVIALQSCGCATMFMIEQTGVSHERSQNIRQAYARTNQVLVVYEAEIWHDSTARPSGLVTRYAVVDLTVPMLTNKTQMAIARGRPSKSELSAFQPVAVISDNSGSPKKSWAPATNTIAVRTHGDHFGIIHSGEIAQVVPLSYVLDPAATDRRKWGRPLRVVLLPATVVVDIVALPIYALGWIGYFFTFNDGMHG